MLLVAGGVLDGLSGLAGVNVFRAAGGVRPGTDAAGGDAAVARRNVGSAGVGLFLTVDSARRAGAGICHDGRGVRVRRISVVAADSAAAAARRGDGDGDQRVKGQYLPVHLYSLLFIVINLARSRALYDQFVGHPENAGRAVGLRVGVRAL